MIPNSAIAAGFAMPPSTTAEAAATFCSYVYLACLPSMVSSASLPNARYICCHFSTVWRGTRRVLAVDVRPWPRSKSSDALLRTSISCFTLRSVRIRKASHSMVLVLPPRGSSCAQSSTPPRNACRRMTRRRVLLASETKAGTTLKTFLKLSALSFCFCLKGRGGQPFETQ